MEELATLWALRGVEDNAGVALVELAALRLRPVLHMGVHAAPDLHAGLLAEVLPRGLGGGRVFPQGLVHIGAGARAELHGLLP